MNLAKTIWWWQLGWRDGWTPDSTTKFGCDVNIKSIHEEEFSNKSVGSLINWHNPSWEVQYELYQLDGEAVKISALSSKEFIYF